MPAQPAHWRAHRPLLPRRLAGGRRQPARWNGSQLHSHPAKQRERRSPALPARAVLLRWHLCRSSHPPAHRHRVGPVDAGGDRRLKRDVRVLAWGSCRALCGCRTTCTPARPTYQPASQPASQHLDAPFPCAATPILRPWPLSPASCCCRATSTWQHWTASLHLRPRWQLPWSSSLRRR